MVVLKRNRYIKLANNPFDVILNVLLPQVEIVELDESWLEGQIHVYSRVEDVGNLASMANFARFYFPRLFPQLTRAIYVDVDTVVVGEIREFWERLQMTEQLLLAVPRWVRDTQRIDLRVKLISYLIPARPSPSYGSMFTGKVKQLFQERYGRSFADSDPTFNAGVYGVNLDLWRRKDVHLEVMFWMEQVTAVLAMKSLSFCEMGQN